MGTSETFTFEKLPQNAAELAELVNANGKSEFAIAAYAVLSLCVYETNPQEAINMINSLKGPQPLSNYDISFLKDRLTGKTYKPRSFFAGATPDNSYEPEKPYKITVSANPYSYDEENYAVLYLKSGGADSERPVKLRKKPSTGEWFLWEIQFLSDIREPKANDPWA